MFRAREYVEKLIEKKKKRINRFKDPRHCVCEFINTIDRVITTSKDQNMFSTGVYTAIGVLEVRIKKIDPDVGLRIQWNTSSNWENMRVEGVEIFWSENYLNNSLLKSPTTYIDVGQLFIEGYFDS